MKRFDAEVCWTFPALKSWFQRLILLVIQCWSWDPGLILLLCILIRFMVVVLLASFMQLTGIVWGSQKQRLSLLFSMNSMMQLMQNLWRNHLKLCWSLILPFSPSSLLWLPLRCKRIRFWSWMRYADNWMWCWSLHAPMVWQGYCASV
jgi:hypothetical protein